MKTTELKEVPLDFTEYIYPISLFILSWVFCILQLKISCSNKKTYIKETPTAAFPSTSPKKEHEQKRVLSLSSLENAVK